MLWLGVVELAGSLSHAWNVTSAPSEAAEEICPDDMLVHYFRVCEHRMVGGVKYSESFYLYEGVGPVSWNIGMRQMIVRVIGNEDVGRTLL